MADVLRGEIARLHAIGGVPKIAVDADGSGGSAVTAISALHSKNIARLVRRLAASLRVAKRALAADEAAEAKKERGSVEQTRSRRREREAAQGG